MTAHENKLCKDCRWLYRAKPEPWWMFLLQGPFSANYHDVPRCLHPAVNATRGGFLVDGEWEEAAHAWHERSDPYGNSACGNEGKLWEPK